MKDRAFGSRAPAPLLALLLAALLGACSAMDKRSVSAPVEQRMQEHLDLVLAQDFAAAYDYLSPGYRSGVSVADYQREQFSRPARFVDGTLGESVCSEGVCKVRVFVDYVIYGALPGVSEFKSKSAYDERWLEIDGVWYLVPE